MFKKILVMFVMSVAFTLLALTFVTPTAPWGADLLPYDPSRDGREWDISFENGEEFENAVCVMWNRHTNSSEWVLRDGTHVVQIGSAVYTIPPQSDDL